jgi:hypothetical protein
MTTIDKNIKKFQKCLTAWRKYRFECQNRGWTQSARACRNKEVQISRIIGDLKAIKISLPYGDRAMLMKNITTKEGANMATRSGSKWTKVEVKRVLSLKRRGHTFREISEVMNRSLSSVSAKYYEQKSIA